MNPATSPANELYESPVPGVKPEQVIETGPGLKDNDLFELITGDDVMALLITDSGFRQSWDLLFAACPWATVFQSRAFITAWYQAYREEHYPVLIKAVENGQLKGLLPMVLLDTKVYDEHTPAKKGRIAFAGHYESLYQTWLAAPSDGDAFIKKALTELLERFPNHTISLRFVPRGTPLDWVKKDKQWQQYCILQTHTRPLIKLSHTEEEKIFQRRKHFKHKFNRLKRAGEVQFETIKDLHSFESSLPEMAVMYDFRQSALFNKSPFTEDPAYKELMLELFRLQLLHVTVLKLNGKMIAAIVAVGEKDWMYLAGINCHSPVNARWFSPGFLHFILLSQQLSEEGYNFFDLTPGYDTYKDELANDHDEVHELVISGKPAFRLKRRLRKWVHARLIAAGKRPMTAELSLKWFMYLLKHRTPGSLLKELLRRLQRKEKQQRYWLQAYTPAATGISLKKDDLTDLQEFATRKKSNLSKWEFLGNAAYRLERGQHCYTWVENGRLLACAWFSYQDPQAAKKDDKPENDNTIELLELYCHADAKDRLTGFVNEVIDRAVNKEKKNYLQTSEPLFWKALELAGGKKV